MVEASIMTAARPLLENPAGVIREAQVLIVNDLNVATDPLVKQVYNGEDQQWVVWRLNRKPRTRKSLNPPYLVPLGQFILVSLLLRLFESSNFLEQSFESVFQKGVCYLNDVPVN